MDKLDARDLVWRPPIVSHTGCGQTKFIAHVRIKVDHLVRVWKVLGLRGHREVPRVVFRQEVAILLAPARDARRRIHGHGGGDRPALDAWRTGRDLSATDEAQAAVVEVVGVEVVDRMLLGTWPHVDVDVAIVERGEGP